MKGVILLTGATGFVGRQVFNILQQQGFQMRLVIREGSESKIANMTGVESVHLTRDMFRETSEWWFQVCKGVEIVIHTAWYAEPGLYLESEENINCMIGTLNLAIGAVKAKIKRFTGIGTCAEYDLSNGVVTNKTKLAPKNLYAVTKASVYQSLSRWFENEKIEFLWCRLFYLYGTGEDPRRLSSYIREKIAKGEKVELTSGEQIRDYLDVSEAANKIIQNSLGTRVGAVNISSGFGVTIKDFAEKIADEFGRKDLLVFGVRPSNEFDPSVVIGKDVD